MNWIILVTMMVFSSNVMAVSDISGSSVDIVNSLQFIKLDPVDIRTKHNLRLIYDVYNFDRTMDDKGNAITIVHMPEMSIEYEIFVIELLDTNLTAYRNLLESKKAVGMSLYIIRARNAEEMIKIIETTPSSIGYTSKEVYINEGDNNAISIIDISPDWE